MSLFDTLLSDAEHFAESELPSVNQIRPLVAALVHRLEAELPQLAERGIEDVLAIVHPAEADTPQGTVASEHAPAGAAVAPSQPAAAPDAPAGVPGLKTPETDAAEAAAAAPSTPADEPPIVTEPAAIDPAAPGNVPPASVPAAGAAIPPPGTAGGSLAPQPGTAATADTVTGPDTEGEDRSLADMDAEAADLERRLAQLRNQRDAAAQQGIAVTTVRNQRDAAAQQGIAVTTEPIEPPAPLPGAPADSGASS